MNDSWLTRTAWRWPSVPWTKNEESRSLTKRRILLTRITIPRAMTQRSYHDEKCIVTGILDHVVLVTSCADVDIVLTYLTIYRRHVSVSHVASHTLPRDRRHWRRRYFVRRFSSRRMTHIVLHSSWKRMLSAVEEIDRISSISSMFFFPSYFFEFARKATH